MKSNKGFKTTKKHIYSPLEDFHPCYTSLLFYQFTNWQVCNLQESFLRGWGTELECCSIRQESPERGPGPAIILWESENQTPLQCTLHYTLRITLSTTWTFIFFHGFSKRLRFVESFTDLNLGPLPHDSSTCENPWKKKGRSVSHISLSVEWCSKQKPDNWRKSSGKIRSSERKNLWRWEKLTTFSSWEGV